MANTNTYKRQWIMNSDNEYVAPYTLMSQVISDKNGTSLDVYLDNILNNREDSENIYYLSHNKKPNETFEQTLQRLLAISGQKTIILDQNITITSSIIINSNTSLIGINKDITITQDPQNVSGNACITQSQDIKYGISLSNVYLANFKITSNSTQRFAIYFGGSYDEIIDCKNCVIENVECNSVRGCTFYANNITLKNLKMQMGYTTGKSYGFICSGSNFNIYDCEVLKHENVEFNINNSSIVNLSIADGVRNIAFNGDSNTYNNIVSKNNNTNIKITGKNIYYQGISDTNDLSNKDIKCDFILDIQNSTMTLSACGNIDRYLVKLLHINSNNILNMSKKNNEEITAYGMVKDYWTTSEINNLKPFFFNSDGLSFTHLGNGKYLLNGSVSGDTIVPIQNEIPYLGSSPRASCPPYLSIIETGSETPTIKLVYTTDPNPNTDDYKEYQGTSLNKGGFYPDSFPKFALKVNGNFNNTIIQIGAIPTYLDNLKHHQIDIK